MSFVFENNFWFHCQMDFDYIFRNRKKYESLEDLLDKNEHFKKEDLYYFAVSPDDKTTGFNFLLAKYKEPFEYKKGQRSKVVNYRVLGAYSMDGKLDIPAATDTNQEEFGWTINNSNVTMAFSKMHIELFEECGSVYRHILDKGDHKYMLWKEIYDKYTV